VAPPTRRGPPPPAGPPGGKTPSLKDLAQSLRGLPKTFRLVAATARGTLLGLLFVTLLTSLFPVAIAWAGKHLIDGVVAKNRETALRWVGIELALLLALVAAQRIASLLSSVLSARLSVDINVEILRKATGLGLSYFEDAATYDQLTRARREASSRPVASVTGLFALARDSLSFLGYAAILISFKPWLVVALILLALPSTISELRFSAAAFRLRNWRSPETRKLSYLEYVLSNDSHAKEVKLFDLGPMLLERYRGLGEIMYKEDRSLAAKRSLYGYLLSAVSTIAVYAFYGWTAASAAMGVIGIGSMTLYMASVRQGQDSLRGVLAQINGVYENHLYMTNLFAFLEIPDTALLEATKDDRATEAQVAAQAGITFEDVGFRYPGKETFSLRHVNFHVPKGTSLALVGHNGAGKTTIIKLLARMYEATEGRILIDGVDVRTLPPEEVRRRMSVVFQDFNRYQLAARENVGLGSVTHWDEDARIERAVDNGGATEVIAGLPDGLDTQLGGWFARGTELSGGQWQKLALSRAFMREEADVLVLDEPTSALDAEAEHAVFQRFAELTKGRTSFLVSHRFPTVRMADRIVVLEDGTVREEGTHEELLALHGRYAELFSLQAKGYL
jgi:ATP-binding cassette, subfamily B, bacterial